MADMDTGAWFGYVLRLARRETDLSQRQLARWSGLAKSTIADAEMGRVNISLQTARSLLATMGFELQVRAPDGELIDALLLDQRRDAVGRRFPAHLDLVPKTEGEVEREERWRRFDWPVRHQPPPSHYFYRLDRFHRDTARAHGYYGELGRLPRTPPVPDLVMTAAWRHVPWITRFEYPREARSGQLQTLDDIDPPPRGSPGYPQSP